MSLRDEAIEAMAEGVYTQRWGPSMSGPKPGPQDWHIAASALDRLLDYLTEHPTLGLVAPESSLLIRSLRGESDQ